MHLLLESQYIGLNFAQRPIFSVLCFFTEPKNPYAPELHLKFLLRDLLRPGKQENPSTSSIEARILLDIIKADIVIISSSSPLTSSIMFITGTGT